VQILRSETRSPDAKALYICVWRAIAEGVILERWILNVLRTTDFGRLGERSLVSTRER